VRGTAPVVESVMKRLTAALPGSKCGRCANSVPPKARCWNEFADCCLPRAAGAHTIGAGRAGGDGRLAIERGATFGLMKAIGGLVRRVMHSSWRKLCWWRLPAA